MTANFDAAKSAALAVTLLDWREYGAAYSQAMIDVAQALAQAWVLVWALGSALLKVQP